MIFAPSRLLVDTFGGIMSISPSSSFLAFAIRFKIHCLDIFSTPTVSAQIQQIEKELRKTAHFHNVTFCTSKPFYLEFFNSKVSKAAAIDCIGKLYDFTPAETIAIGDGFNDLSMIRYAALGVAMENAPDGVKESADYITARTNNEDGVAEVLEKFVL